MYGNTVYQTADGQEMDGAADDRGSKGAESGVKRHSFAALHTLSDVHSVADDDPRIV